MKNQTPFLLVLGCCCLWFCSPKVADATRNYEQAIASVEKEAAARYKAFSLIENADKSHVLVVNRNNYQAGKQRMTCRFFLFEMKNQEIILEDFVDPGSLSWKDNEILMVDKYVGEIDDDQSSERGYHYHVNTRTKVPL